MSDWAVWTIPVAATLAFALAAFGLRAVTGPGAVAGAGVALTLWISCGAGAFASLAAVFAITFAGTRFRRERKQRLGVAESRRGRSAAQVLANLGAAGVFSVLGSYFPSFRYAAMAALAEAAADTACSEIGEAASDRAYLITSFRRVPAGTDGAISAIGTLAGLIAAVVVSAVAAGTGVIRWSGIGYVVAAGVIGTFADSVLGDLLERRGVIGNETVNFLSSAIAGLSVIGLSRAV